MTDLNIPTLDIEDFDLEAIEVQQADEIKDEAGGALTYAASAPCCASTNKNAINLFSKYFTHLIKDLLIF